MKCGSCGHESTPTALRCEACDDWLDQGDAPSAEPETGRTGISGSRKAPIVSPSVPTPPVERPVGRTSRAADSGVATSAGSHCFRCGQPTQAAWRFCKSCGAALRPASSDAQVRTTMERTLPPERTIPGGSSVSGSAKAWATVRHLLVRVSTEDGGDRRVHELDRETTVVGRTTGDVVVPTDSTMSGRHAAFEVRADGCFLRDLGSTNGSFVAVTSAEPLTVGAVLLVGSQRLLYRRDSRGQRELVQVLPRGRDGRIMAVSRDSLTIGKDAADLSFPDDEYMSKIHAEIVRSGEGHAVRDLGSTNRTYLIVKGERELVDGDRVALGETVFEYRRLVSR